MLDTLQKMKKSVKDNGKEQWNKKIKKCGGSDAKRK